MVAGVDEGKSDVFDNRESGDEVEVLEDEADFFGAEAGLTTGGDARDGFVVQQVDARGGGVEETDDVEKSGLAATGRTHNHNELATADGEVEIFEGERGGVAIAKALGEALKFDDDFVFLGH